MSEPRHPRPNPTRGGSPGTYCMWCGTPLVVVFRPDGFDRDTGEPRFERRADCPKALAESTKENR